MATVADFTKLPGATPPAHAYDRADIGPIEFLKCVMHDTTLPIATRIYAASALLPFTEPKPRATAPITCTIRIEGISPDNGISQSNPEFGEYNRHPQSGDQGPSNIDDDPPPSKPKPFLSTPGISFIDRTEILEVKAAVNKLRPDLAHHPLPDQFYHCSCWDCWITCPCDCPRDASKLN
jgi:hypothetical protein